MKTLENRKKTFILGGSGKRVECMLLESQEEIKKSNPTLTDEELETVFNLIFTEIEDINRQNKLSEEENL